MVVPPIISDSTKPTPVRVAASRLTRALSRLVHPREPKLDAAISQIRAAGIDCVATSFGFSIQNPELNETALMHAGKEARQLVSVAIVGQGEKEFKHWFARLDYLQIAELIVDAFSRNGGLQPIEGFRNQLMDLDSQFDKTELDNWCLHWDKQNAECEWKGVQDLR